MFLAKPVTVFIILFLATPCADPGTPHDGTQSGDSFESGQIILYSCDKPGFSVDFPAIICNEGQWQEFDENTMMSTGINVNTNIDMRPQCIGKLLIKYRNLAFKHPVKASIYALDILAFTRG